MSGFTKASGALTRRTLLIGAGASGAVAGLGPRALLGQTRLDITQGTVQPITTALPDFVAGTGADGEVARNATQVVSDNLKRSCLFAPVDPAAFIERIGNIDLMPRFADWRAINAQALVTGRITRQSDGRLKAEFRL